MNEEDLHLAKAIVGLELENRDNDNNTRPAAVKTVAGKVREKVFR